MATSVADAPEQHFRQNVIRLRRQRDWTQNHLAARLEEMGHPFYQQTVQRIEQGERVVRLGEAEAIARVFGVDLATMMAPSDLEPEELSWSADRCRSESKRLYWMVSSSCQAWRQSVSQFHAVAERFPAEDDGVRRSPERGALLGASEAARLLSQLLTVLQDVADTPKQVDKPGTNMADVLQEWLNSANELTGVLPGRRGAPNSRAVESLT